MNYLKARRAKLRVGGFQILAIASLPLLGGCTAIGPDTGAVLNAPVKSTISGIQIVEMTETVAERAKLATPPGFAETFGEVPAVGGIIRRGDTLEVSIWEAPPAALFNSGSVSNSYLSDNISALTTSRTTQLPELLVGPSGRVSVPFAGMIQAEGRTLPQIEQEITARLRGKAHLPQVMVRLLRNETSTVTVVGDVEKSARVPLTPKGERLLDALAAAGGTRQPIDKMTVQISRAGNVRSMPLKAVISDPRQNITLSTDDVVTALYQPFSFTVLGATGKNEEVNFEGTGLTLAQAVGRIGGLQDARADPKGMFLFRWEEPTMVSAPAADVQARRDGRIPVIYRINMKDPSTYFIMQNFVMRDKDVIFVANSRLGELQRFVNIIASTVLPIATVDNLLTN